MLARCDLFVGNDSGLMHLAAAAGAPTLGLFGPDAGGRIRPGRAPHRRRAARAGTGWTTWTVADALAAALPLVGVAGMTRVAQVMAGAVNGGAELFFERLCIALARGRRGGAAGDPHRPRARGAARAGRAGAGATRASARRSTSYPPPARPRARRLPPARRGGLDEPRQHARPARGLAAGGPARRLLRPALLPPLRLAGGQHARHRRLAARPGLGGGPHPLPAQFRRRFRRRPRRRPTCRAGRPLLLGLGRLHTDKGFDLAIRALPACPGRCWRSPAKGRSSARCRTLARRERVAERVHFLGWRHDAGALLRAADLFVCSSRVEPLGNMVIEAWSAGCPVVAAAAAGPAELLRDGADGALVPMEDPAALAEGIAALLEDPPRRAACTAAGRARFETEFAAAPVVAPGARSWPRG